MLQYNDLSELLESDSSAMAFYNSLPITLQKRMYSSGVSTFQHLYESARDYKPHEAYRPPQAVLSAASANETTGLIPQGDDHSESAWRGFSSIEPFGLPPQDK